MTAEPIREAEKRLCATLAACAAQFRGSEDAAALESLASGADDLEHLLDLCRAMAEPAVPASRVLGVLRTLEELLINRDIAGLTDYLEYHICPELDSWDGESDGT